MCKAFIQEIHEKTIQNKSSCRIDPIWRELRCFNWDRIRKRPGKEPYSDDRLRATGNAQTKGCQFHNSAVRAGGHVHAAAQSSDIQSAGFLRCVASGKAANQYRSVAADELERAFSGGRRWWICGSDLV